LHDVLQNWVCSIQSGCDDSPGAVASLAESEHREQPILPAISQSIVKLTFPRKIVSQGWRKINVTFGKESDEATEAGIYERVQGAVGQTGEVWPVARVARDLGLIEQTLRNWVKAADAGKLNGAGGKVVTPEQMELSRLRAENIRLKRECEILKNRS